MELIPILSTIILAATASTFLLAIGAYILYKIRERRGKRNIIQPPIKLEAELVTPIRNGNEKFPDELRVHPSDDAKKTKQNLNLSSSKDEGDIKKEKNLNSASNESRKPKSKFLKYTSEGYISPKDDKKTGNVRWR